MENLQLIATCPMGLESIVSYELKQLGYEDQMTENGRVTFRASLSDIPRTNLWLRTADRVLVKMGEFQATTFEALFEQTKALPWPTWVPAHAEFPVQGRSQKSQLSSVPACQSIVKKAIVEKMKEAYRTDWFEETGPLYAIEVSLHKDVATLTLDTTGPSLHKRGYRKLVTEAPIKETMAAALVYISRWKPEWPLYDPFCGSGTIAIEAAMIGWNVAPGLRRSFPSEHWPIIPEEDWDTARNEAYDAVNDDIPLQIGGSDIDASAIDIAIQSAKSAGFSKEISFKALPVHQASPHGHGGIIITNPPYGERISEQREVESLIQELGKLHRRMQDWSTFAISPTKTFERHFGQEANKRRKLYNGRIECQYYQYFNFPKKKKSDHS
ncbi:THUMP domain-containing class I SAM-dependent RNA methyltransferase [Marinicrinis sediminis]|uniref:Class I SAM-dependent RNA methyltransferase n=1 Tax=Marinicrinis sediminis TaxID=1652465 RepID=A0ABW5RF35_9BACL